MKQLTETWQIIEGIVERDPRYKANSYSFVMAALEQTISSLDSVRHVTARELLAGIKRYAIQQFGPMALQVLAYWGVHDTKDFGNIVYNLIDAGLACKSDDERLEDFTGVYDFQRVFEDDYYRE